MFQAVAERRCILTAPALPCVSGRLSVVDASDVAEMLNAVVAVVDWIGWAHCLTACDGIEYTCTYALRSTLPSRALTYADCWFLSS